MLATGIPEALGTDPALGQRACWTACSPSPPSGRHLRSPLALVLCHFRGPEPPAAWKPAAPAASFLGMRASSLGDNPPATEPEPGGRSRQRLGLSIQQQRGRQRRLGLGLGLGLGRTAGQPLAHTASRTKNWERDAERTDSLQGLLGHANPQSSSVQGSTQAWGATKEAGRGHSSPPRLLPVQPPSLGA